VGQLSQGEKRRVALARLLLQQAPLWILDEPLEALDSVGIRVVADILQAHAAAGGAVLMTSHIPVPLPHVRTMELGAALSP
jgi:heme exporter protein A